MRAAAAEAGTYAAALYAHAPAARHFATALELTPQEDVEARAPLLLGLATAEWNLDRNPVEMLEAAADAHREIAAWEGAARAERMLGHWLGYHEARGEEAEVRYVAAAELAARIPPSDLMCEIAAGRCIRLAQSGHADAALELCNGLLPVAERAGLLIGHALLLGNAGYLRVSLGDGDAIPDSRAAADVLACEGHSCRTVVADQARLVTPLDEGLARREGVVGAIGVVMGDCAACYAADRSDMATQCLRRQRTTRVPGMLAGTWRYTLWRRGPWRGRLAWKSKVCVQPGRP